MGVLVLTSATPATVKPTPINRVGSRKLVAMTVATAPRCLEREPGDVFKLGGSTAVAHEVLQVDAGALDLGEGVVKDDVEVGDDGHRGPVWTTSMCSAARIAETPATTTAQPSMKAKRSGAFAIAMMDTP